jgi:hypothetical protein
MNATETRTVADYAADKGITTRITAAYGHRTEHNGEKWEHFAYRVQLRNKTTGQRFTMPWVQGVGVSGTPDKAPADVLDSVLSDAWSVLQSGDFEDWASDYGYDLEDPETVRKCRRTYNACERLAEQLTEFLGGPDELEDLSTNYERL